MNSIQILVHEHDNILRMLDVIKYASLRLLRGGGAETEDFRKMIDFVRTYADKGHHGKEEEFLFKAMMDELGSMGVNLIRHGMLVEHDLGRLHISDLEAAVDAFDDDASDENALSILVSAGSYVQLLRRHIKKENDVVFPFGENKLSKAALEWVEEQSTLFENDEQNAFESKKQLDILDAMEYKYN